MSVTDPPPGISQSDWQVTPVAVRQLVQTLLASVGQLQQEVAQLREQVNKNSQNSSKPPSSDPWLKGNGNGGVNRVMKVEGGR